jgi:hypothetical protein
MEVTELVNSKEFLAAIVGALVGAVSGGLISFLIQLVALRSARKLQLLALDETREQRDQDQLEVRKALAHSLLFKLMKIASNNYGLFDHIHSGLSRPDDQPKWAMVEPIINLPDRVTFTSEEMSLLMALKESDLLNRVINLDLIHNSLIDAMAAYGIQRMALTDRLSAVSIDDTHVETHLSPEQAATLAPKMMALDQLVDHLHGRARLDYDEAAQTLNALHSFLDGKLHLGFKLEMLRKPQPV